MEKGMKEIKIAYCIPALYFPSGMERVLTQKANWLAQQGVEVHIILTDGGRKPPYFTLHPSISLHQLDIDFEKPYSYPLLKRFFVYRRKMRLFKKALQTCLVEISPDITISLLRRDINIIHQMTDGSIKLGEIHFDRMHYRQFSHRLLPAFINRWISHFWMQSLVRNVRKLKRFVVLTHEDAACWHELTNIAVIPNPVAFFPDEVSACQGKQVIAVGRLVEQKGFERLVAAWQSVAHRHPDWHLRIYGDGHLRESLQHQIEQLGLHDTCTLEHSTSDIQSAYLQSSISVLSSRFEGFGLVIVEAMACGVPVVANTCYCGPRDIITSEKDGILVPEGDTEALSGAIERLIADESLRKEMGRQARLRAADFQMEKIGRQWMELFEAVINDNNKE